MEKQERSFISSKIEVTGYTEEEKEMYGADIDTALAKIKSNMLRKKARRLNRAEDIRMKEAIQKRHQDNRTKDKAKTE